MTVRARGAARSAANADQALSADVEWMPLGRLRGWDRNPNRHPSGQVSQLAEAIVRFGFVVPVVVYASPDGQMEVRAGHGRLEAMRLLLKGDPTFRPRNAPPGSPAGVVPVLRLPVVSRAEADAFALADTALSRLGVLDEDLAAQILRELRDEEVDLCGLGFDGDLDRLLASLAEETTVEKPWAQLTGKPAGQREVTVALHLLVPSGWDEVEEAVRRLQAESPCMAVGEAVVELARRYLRAAP